MNNTTLAPRLATTTALLRVYRSNECAYFYYDNLALILWVTASVFCFAALISTIITIYNSYLFWSTVQDLENSIIDLIDEACQILLPLGVCKQIGHPNLVPMTNANYGQKGGKQEQKPGRKDNRYPEDVTFPPSDIEKVYDVMADEESRPSKSYPLHSLEESAGVSEKKEVKKVVSREFQLQKTPIQSRENLQVVPSREPMVSREATSLKKVQQTGSFAKMSMEVNNNNRTPSREPIAGPGSRETTPKGSLKGGPTGPARGSLSKETLSNEKLKKSPSQIPIPLETKMSMEAAIPRNLSKETASKPMDKSPILPPASTPKDAL